MILNSDKTTVISVTPVTTNMALEGFFLSVETWVFVHVSQLFP